MPINRNTLIDAGAEIITTRSGEFATIDLFDERIMPGLAGTGPIKRSNVNAMREKYNVPEYVDVSYLTSDTDVAIIGSKGNAKVFLNLLANEDNPAVAAFMSAITEYPSVDEEMMENDEAEMRCEYIENYGDYLLVQCIGKEKFGQLVEALEEEDDCPSVNEWIHENPELEEAISRSINLLDDGNYEIFDKDSIKRAFEEVFDDRDCIKPNR